MCIITLLNCLIHTQVFLGMSEIYMPFANQAEANARLIRSFSRCHFVDSISLIILIWHTKLYFWLWTHFKITSVWNRTSFSLVWDLYLYPFHLQHVLIKQWVESIYSELLNSSYSTLSPAFSDRAETTESHASASHVLEFPCER